jgi:hypothetical protein
MLPDAVNTSSQQSHPWMNSNVHNSGPYYSQTQTTLQSPNANFSNLLGYQNVNRNVQEQGDKECKLISL